MRSHAKASSAGSTQRQAGSLGAIVRGAFATRGTAGGAGGSGAPSYRGRLVLLSLSALALSGLALLVASASASKEVTNWFGSESGQGTLGGEFNQPRDIAVNRTGAGGVPAGTIYVADDNNSRIQRFAPSGAFVSAWGADVLTPGVNEEQTLTVNATGGTYTLSFGGETTAPLAYNASRSAVQTALRNLPAAGGSGSSNLDVSQFPVGEGPYKITFRNSLAATNVPQISVDDNNLSGSASTAHPTQGFGKYEVCTVAANCLRGEASGGANVADTAKNGSLDNPQSVAVDGDTGNVYVSDRDNRRVNEYSATGTFIRSFGWGVDATTAGSAYEVCPASDRCTFGIAGSGAGQIGSTGTAGTLGITVSQPDGEAAVGTVFLADSQNRRVDTFNLDGTSPASFGSSTNFESTQPRKIAVDSRGIVYASNSKNQGEIERYDSENANGGGAVFLAPITAANSSPAGPLLAGSAATATSGLAVHADSDGGGNADTDVLYVLRDPSSGNTVVQQFGTTNQPGLSAAPTAVDDTHGAGAGFTTVNGLGLNDATGQLYVAVVDNIPGVSGFPHRVYVLGEAPAPEATLDPITSFDAHSAIFTGAINPEGAETGYRFEYVDDADFQATGFTNASRFPVADANLGHGESSMPIEIETPHHLVPSTTYHVRLVAKQLFSSVETIGGPETFTTPGASPSFETTAIAREEEATLRAAINPEGQGVADYHFEWGTDESYGNSTTSGTLPADGEPVAVEEPLGGLTPGQTYHYRLLATNANGTTTGPDQTFTATTAPQFPQRGYEIASQYPTGGVPIVEVTGRQDASEDGDRLAISAVNPLPGSTLPPLPDDPTDDSLGGVLQYPSERGPNGWRLTETGIGGSTHSGAWSANLERLLTTTETGAMGSGARFEDPRVDPDDQNESVDVYQWQPDGRLVWISRDSRIPAGTAQTAPGEASLASATSKFTMSSDGRTVVFRSRRALSEADTTPYLEGPNGENFSVRRLYKWEDGQLSFIGVRPDGSVPPTGSELGGSPSYSRYAVSSDGSRVVWSAARSDSNGAGTALYVQRDGLPTVEATKEEGVTPLPSAEPYGVTYRGAAADDSRVFFTSASRMTPDSGAGAKRGGASDLYVYDVATNKLRDLTPRLDGIDDPNVEPATTDMARVLGVAANSEDGKRVYFVAEGRYPTAPNPEGDLPSSGRNLYMAELAGIDEPIKLRFIATLGAEDDGDWYANWAESNGPGNINSGKTALASPDGSVLGFASTQSLAGRPVGATAQLYVYDASSGALDCASCPGDGSLPSDSVNTRIVSAVGSESEWQGEGSLRRWVSSDGAVFFNTATRLLPADQNVVNDVYEYREGELRLITTGTATADSLFSNASRDGSTVFFNTQAALVPQDKEPGINKIYAARVGGGFPYVPPPPPCDFNAGACEGPTSEAAEAPGAGTAAFEGPGNPAPNRAGRCPKGKRKVHRKGRTHCVKRHRRKRRHARHHKRTAKYNRRAGR